MTETRPPVFVLGGRTGDIIQLLPCFKAILERTGAAPIVVTTTEYSGVFDGVSYARPVAVDGNWWGSVPLLKETAQRLARGGCVLPYWSTPPQHEDAIGWDGRNWTTLQSHGHQHGVNMGLDPCYAASMVRRAGFTVDEWKAMPLVFDRRDPLRESELAAHLSLDGPRPVLLYNFTGVSSPFPWGPQVLHAINHRNRYRLINLGRVRGARIYDLLALYEHPNVRGIVTSDTATLHLAAAVAKPFVAFTVDGWTSSIPKGNCRLEVKYNGAEFHMGEIAAEALSWLP